MKREASDSQNRVLLEVKDRIAIVTLNRPDKCNAFDLGMFESVVDTINQIKRDPSLRAVILTGQGAHFSTGINVKTMFKSRTAALKLMWKWWPGLPNIAQKVSVGWKRLPIPVIAVIRGRCWGAGMQVALGADFRYATPDASLAIMETKWGLIPDMAGSLGLRKLMPIDQAMALTMTAKEISGEQALKINLVTQVAEDPLQEAMALATSISQRSPDAITAIKDLYHKAWHHNDAKLLMREWASQVQMLLKKNRVIAVKKAKASEDGGIEFKDRGPFF